MPLAPDKHIHAFNLIQNMRILYTNIFLSFSIYLICVSEYEPSWQNVLEGVTTQIPDHYDDI